MFFSGWNMPDGMRAERTESEEVVCERCEHVTVVRYEQDCGRWYPNIENCPECGKELPT